MAVAVFEVGFIRGGLGNKHTEKKLVLVSRDRTRTTTIYIKGNDLLLTPLPSSILRQFVLLTNLLLNFYSHTTIEMALFTYRISRNSNRSWIITAPVIVTAGQFLTKKMIIVTSVLLRLLLREIWYIYPIFGENLTNKVIGTVATITGNTVVVILADVWPHIDLLVVYIH